MIAPYYLLRSLCLGQLGFAAPFGATWLLIGVEGSNCSSLPGLSALLSTTAFADPANFSYLGSAGVPADPSDFSPLAFAVAAPTPLLLANSSGPCMSYHNLSLAPRDPADPASRRPALLQVTLADPAPPPARLLTGAESAADTWPWAEGTTALPPPTQGWSKFYAPLAVQEVLRRVCAFAIEAPRIKMTPMKI